MWKKYKHDLFKYGMHKSYLFRRNPFISIEMLTNQTQDSFFSLLQLVQYRLQILNIILFKKTERKYYWNATHVNDASFKRSIISSFRSMAKQISARVMKTRLKELTLLLLILHFICRVLIKIELVWSSRMRQRI